MQDPYHGSQNGPHGTQSGTSSPQTYPNVETLLARLKGVRRAGEGRWTARCPAHADHNPSLSIAEGSGGFLLVHCHAGCETQAVLDAIGLTFADLMPFEAPTEHVGKRLACSPRALLGALLHELTLALIVLSDLARRQALSEEDANRALEAKRRILLFLAELQKL